MANVQKQFDQFHDAIKLGRFEENQTLREKRDIIRNKLKTRLPEVFKKYGEEVPEFYFVDQGSYELDTGVRPLDSDYDIDQGLYFKISTNQYTDPVVLKKRVREALQGHTASVRIRRPCVTVEYLREGEAIYHVDLAIYRDGSAYWLDGLPRLAVGREGSQPESRKWEVSNPRRLSELIRDRFKGNDAKQFRRVVRYLKRWKDWNFPSNGAAAPLGIAITVLAYHDLRPAYVDALAGKPDDLTALRAIVDSFLSRFSTALSIEGGLKWVRRIELALPVEPCNDLFESMTEKQMENLEAKLKELKAPLDSAAGAVDPVEACKALRKAFGEDFPIPEKAETAKAFPPAIVSSSNNA